MVSPVRFTIQTVSGSFASSAARTEAMLIASTARSAAKRKRLAMVIEFPPVVESTLLGHRPGFRNGRLARMRVRHQLVGICRTCGLRRSHLAMYRTRHYQHL